MPPFQHVNNRIVLGHALARSIDDHKKLHLHLAFLGSIMLRFLASRQPPTIRRFLREINLFPDTLAWTLGTRSGRTTERNCTRGGKSVGKRQWRQACALGIILSVLTGCGAQANYMRRWRSAEGMAHRWTGGTLREQKLSIDEAAVFAQWGTPDVIRFFRSTLSRQRVYEWIYREPEQIVWLVDGQRVEYVAVDTNTSSVPQASRDETRDKLIAGGALAGAVGGVAAGFIALGKSIGLRD